jgi:predicted ATPase
MTALPWQRESFSDNQTTRPFLQQLEAKNQAESSPVFSSRSVARFLAPVKRLERSAAIERFERLERQSEYKRFDKLIAIVATSKQAT